MPDPTPRLRSRLAAGLCAFLVAAPAVADAPAFGPRDVPTVFFIAKSDDRNRVDYALRLDDACAPVAKGAVVPYWRVFEKAPPVRTHPIAWYEHVAYGIDKQRVVAHESHTALTLRLKAISGREITIESRKDASGRCVAVARATINGVARAELTDAFVRLKRPMSVDYVDIHGKDPRTGAPIEERVRQ